jgi:hypothetical protein
MHAVDATSDSVAPRHAEKSRCRPLAAAALLVLACGDPRVGGPLPVASPAPSTFSAIEQNILIPRCATSGCHSGNPPSATPLSLDPDVALLGMVGQPAQQLSTMSQIEPRQPDASYLLLKLRGTAGTAGGVATRMPIGDAPLSDDEIAGIEAWIREGAPND